ncbi:hypothetical protein DCAR_0519089 [Daucus carota subsp. sativus]|uniref:Tafazzin family protein n=1 Tax=Daucus carota subsp. sativus TaxID=79200 RepID=A0AAF1AYT2_DAUCS|nr:hypothetical protein DCAR_0519089 [Daucus carota subsp. sativus]
MRGVPKKIVIGGVGSFSKTLATFLNHTIFTIFMPFCVSSRSRPKGVPLIILDDPVIRGFKGFPTSGPRQGCSWALATQDICFKNLPLSYFFTLGENMNEALDWLSDGEWQLYTFMEGKRLKWGTASLIVRSPVTPIVLPIVHHGFEKLSPLVLHLTKHLSSLLVFLVQCSCFSTRLVNGRRYIYEIASNHNVLNDSLNYSKFNAQKLLEC